MITTLDKSEILVIIALYHNNYGMMDSHEGLTWSTSVNESGKPSGIEGKQLKTILASLMKKEWIKVSGFGRDDTVQWASQDAYERVVELIEED